LLEFTDQFASAAKFAVGRAAVVAADPEKRLSCRDTPGVRWTSAQAFRVRILPNRFGSVRDLVRANHATAAPAWFRQVGEKTRTGRRKGNCHEQEHT